ncbi:MAG: hypothetical protein AMXMBFR53_06560 [Gemmatimonadota bacterium]
MRTHRSVLLLLALSLAAAASSPGRAVPPHRQDALAALAADSARILEDLRFLASDSLRGRAPGTEGSALARGRLRARFQQAGLRPVGGAWEHPFPFTRRGDTTVVTGTNLLGVRDGSERPGRVIVVSGHYDHVGVRGGEIFNGADDNASGAVGITALARALRDVPLRHTVVFAAWDAEESGLRGARAFVAAPPVPLDSVAVNLNLDMVARTAGLLWAGGAHHTPALRPVLEEVAARSPVELRLGHDSPGAPEGDDWTRQSDHAAFHAAGIPFVYLGVEDHADYHRPTDDFERVDPGEYMDALRAALRVLLALDRSLP